MSQERGFDVAGGTLAGPDHRRKNAVAAVDRHLGWFAVADGVAQRPAGDVASSLALEVVRGCFYTPSSTWHKGVLVNPDPKKIECHLFTSLMFANLVIQERGAGSDMATTFAGVVVLPGKLWIAHIGDSRVYRLRGGALERLTTDHRLRDDAWGRAQLSPHDVERMAPNDLTRALGLHDAAISEIRNMDAEAGDVVVLATRGLTDAVDDEAIAEVLVRGRDLEAATAKLLDCARERGAVQDATVVAARCAP